MLSLANFIIRRAKFVLFGFIGLIALSSVWGFQVFGNLQGGGYDDPNSDSATVSELLGTEFALDPAEVLVLVDLPGDANELNAAGVPKYLALVTELSEDLAKVDGVISVVNYYSLGSPESLVSSDGKLVYVLVDLQNGISQSEPTAQIVDEFTGDYLGAKVHIAGFGAVTKAITETIERDLIRAEIIAIPIVLLLLLFGFGSLVAAGLPLLVGGLAIVGSFFVVWGVSELE